MKTLKPLGDRALIKVELIRKKDQAGVEYTDMSREAKVLEVGTGEYSENLKKGATVYYNPRGCIAVEAMQTKKHVFLFIDSCDVYGLLS